MPNGITQKEAAERLGISARQLRRLSDHGCPRNEDGSYPWPETIEWYKGFKQDEILHRKGVATEADPDSWEVARRREKAAKAILAEIEVAERRGELVPIDVHLDRLEMIATRMRAKILNHPGRYTRSLVGRDSPDEVREILEEMSRELLDELSRLEVGTGNGEVAA